MGEFQEKAIIGFSITYLILALIAAFPRPPDSNQGDFLPTGVKTTLHVVETRLKPVAWKVLHPLGLSQNWEMFSRIENYNDMYFEAEVVGTVSSVRVPVVDLRRHSGVARLMRASNLFFMETLSGGSDEEIFTDLARWAVNQADQKAIGDPLRVQLLMFWRPVIIYSRSPKLDFQKYVLREFQLPFKALIQDSSR